MCTPSPMTGPPPSPNGKSAGDVAENGLLITDMSLEILAFDSGAASIFRDSANNGNNTKSSHPTLRIPDEIRARLANIDVGNLTSDISFSVDKYAYICRASVVNPKNGLMDKPMLALYFRRDTSLDDLVQALARKYHLSEREAQTLQAIATGQSPKEAALQMNISPNTIKSFTRIVMIKMHVDTKAALIAKLLGYYRYGCSVETNGYQHRD